MRQQRRRYDDQHAGELLQDGLHSLAGPSDRELAVPGSLPDGLSDLIHDSVSRGLLSRDGLLGL